MVSETDGLDVVLSPAELDEDDVMTQVYTDLEHDEDFSGDLIEFNPRSIKRTEPTPCNNTVTTNDVITDLIDAADPLIGGKPFVASESGMHFGMAGLMLIAGAEAHYKGLKLKAAQINLSYVDDKGNDYSVHKFFVNNSPNN